MSIQRFLMCVVAVGIWCATPASATLMVYSTQSAFDGATGGDLFSNLSFAQGNLMSTIVTVDGVVFSTDAATLSGITGSSFTGWPTQQGIQASTGAKTITLSIPATANAISFYFGSPVTQDQFIFDVTDAGGGHYHVEPNINGTAAPYFIGLTTDSTFATLTVTGSYSFDQVTLADVNLGDPAATPEVGTFLMVGGGLLGLRFLKRRKIGTRIRQAAAQAASSTYQSATSLREAI